MSISESSVARRLRAVPTPPTADRKPPARRAPGATAGTPPADAERPIRTDRIEVCPDCEALVAGEGPLPDGRDPEGREIERGVARLGIARGDQRVTLSSTGERTGHRSTPCGCCRRPLAGDRAVVKRVVTHGAAPDPAD